MSRLSLLFSLGVLSAFLVFSDARRYRRSLDGSGLKKPNEEVTLLKQDVLDHFTSTLDPTKSDTKHASKSEATNHVTESVTEPAFKPLATAYQPEETGEQLQKIPEDSNVEVLYEHKVMLREDNPQAEAPNIKNETVIKDYSNFMKYKYNQSSPTLSVNSEVTVSHSMYEQSSSSVAYSENDDVDEDDDDEYYPTEYESSTKSHHLKSVPEWKKKKKEFIETVTVPTQWSTTKHMIKELPNKVEEIKTDALDERQSTTNATSNLSTYNKLEPDNNSLDLSLTTVSNKDNTISQSKNIVINDGVNINEPNDSSTKKPRMTFSVKKTAVINDTTATVSSLMNPDTARNTVPVLKWEKVWTTVKPKSDVRDKDDVKIVTNTEVVQTIESPQIDSPKITIVKPSTDFKIKLGLNPVVRTKNISINSTNISVDNSTVSKNNSSMSSIKPATSFNEQKQTKLTEKQTDFTVPPTSTALVTLETWKTIGSIKPSISTEKMFVDKKTTFSPMKIKEFVPWSTRLQKSSTTQLSALNTSRQMQLIDGITANPKLSTILDSDTSSSWDVMKVMSSEITSTENSDALFTTTELEGKSTEPDSKESSSITEEMMSDDPSALVSDLPQTTKAETMVTTESKPPISITENIPTSTAKNNPVTTMKAVNISPTPFKVSESANVSHNSENYTSTFDMNQTSNDLKVNESMIEAKFPSKSELKKFNESLQNIPSKDDIFSIGLDEKIQMDDFDDELKKETTHFDLPIEATTGMLNPDFDDESKENDNESERDDEDLIIEKSKSIQKNQPVLENPIEDIEMKLVTNKNISRDDVVLNVTDIAGVITGKPHEGDWYNVSVDVNTTTQSVKDLHPDVFSTNIAQTESAPSTTDQYDITETPTTLSSTEIVTKAVTTTTQTTTPKLPHCHWEDNPPSVESVNGYVSLTLQTSWQELCLRKEELRRAIINMYTRPLETCQVLFFNVNSKDCSNIVAPKDVITVFLYFVDRNGNYDIDLIMEFDERKLQSPFRVLNVKAVQDQLTQVPKDNKMVVLAVSLTCLLAVVVLLIGLVFVIIRKRRKKFNYGQRCTPVSLDDYSLDNISVYNSVRRKGAFRVSKRSYGNPAFDDPNAPSHPVNFAGLANLCNNRVALDEEFSQIPIITLKPDELPVGAEKKNRYANVIPLPETRVQLTAKEGADPLDEYINANYVKGPKGAEKFFIACQAPLQSTVTDFWRMIWQEQCKVILMLTALQENGVDKCADYLPPSQVIDCHCLFGDFQVTFKKHEVREKYLVSCLQLKNLETNSWREVIHLWYLNWPATGVPDECNSVIAFLLEARLYMRNNTGPVVVHCSPGTGRTGTVIAIDLCIREFETSRTVDIPKTVYALRRDRAGAVQTKDQYAFIYQALNLHATKLTGGALDSI